ncbi:gustatory receptor for sugar taste 64f-like [Littorina saxatilis]|uniref:Gustatory receptor n=1 Tax=Littorina saxatilis TaxID=31220 RepID=A0AAN9BXZ6_9CAEN
MEFLEEMRPMFSCMSLLGLFHAPCKAKPRLTPIEMDAEHKAKAEDESSAGLPARDRRPRRSRAPGGSWWFCLLVCFLTWFQFLRFLPSYWVSVEHHANLLQNRIIITFWYLQCALNATVMYKACSRQDQLQEFFRLSRDFCKKFPTHRPNQHQVKRLRRRTTVTVAISWIFNVLNVLIVVVSFSELNEDFVRNTILFTDPFGTSIPSKVFAIFLLFFASSSWTFPITFSCAAASYVRLRFNTLTVNLETAVTGSKTYFPLELEVYRRQHLQLCACVRVLDRTLQRLIMTSYVTNVPLTCFIMYRLVVSPPQAFELGMLIFWLVVNCLNVFFISVWAALVHESACSPVDCLYEVFTSGATQEHLTQLQLFVSRVTGPSVGFTAMGIVTVTKEMVLTLCGILITYFVLLLQYRID